MIAGGKVVVTTRWGDAKTKVEIIVGERNPE